MHSATHPGERMGLLSYAKQHLAGLDAKALIALIVGDGDRIPRSVEMVAALDSLPELSWNKCEDGEWWLLVHAAMIIG